jgi:hypothetical protein
MFGLCNIFFTHPLAPPKHYYNEAPAYIIIIIIYHKNYKMKRNLMPILLLAAGVFFYSCKKTDMVADSEKNTHNSASRGFTDRDTSDREDGFCEATTVDLLAGQTINAGTVTVINDNDYIYVTYTTANGYTLKQTHLYVGGCALIPVNNAGNPVPGQFPYKATHNNATSYTVTVPISAIPAGSCGCIAAHAAVQKLNAAGQVIDSQTGWGNGTLINPDGGNWGMKFAYCSCSPL